MNRVQLLSGFAAVVSAAGAALAGPTARFVDYAWLPGRNGGGPFRFVANSGVGPNYLANLIQGVNPTTHEFLSFCVEENEYINFGHTYDVTIDTSATLGGLGNATPNYTGGSQTVVFSGVGDSLDPRTAFLYDGFIHQTLPGLVWGNSTSGADLQMAIWYLENERSSVTGQAATWVALANAAVTTGSWGNSIHNVRVLNLFENGVKCQSQLVELVPLPAQTTMAGLGLLGLAGVRIARRRRA